MMQLELKGIYPKGQFDLGSGVVIEACKSVAKGTVQAGAS
jgi:hypothetical protein